MSGYRHRRLRKDAPYAVLTYTGPGDPISREIAANVRAAWLRSARSGVVVVDGRTWNVQRVTR